MYTPKPRALKPEHCRAIYYRLIVVALAVAVTVPVLIKSRQNSIVAVLTAFPFFNGKGYISVSGDVKHPGVYPISANLMTMDAIRLAMPCRDLKACSPSGYEATPVKNGADIRLEIGSGKLAEISVGSIPAVHRMILGIPLDINAMSAEDFEPLPGIGPVLAKRIVEYRQFNGGSMEVQELLSVEGIGEKKYTYLKKYFN